MGKPRSFFSAFLVLSCLGVTNGVAVPSAAATQQYLIDSTYTGNTFFNGFDFFTGPDPTHGFVTYISQAQAAPIGLIGLNPAYMGIDYRNVIRPTGPGRQSVRISTKKSWTHGLFIADIIHMPDSICGVWPAYWMFGPNWPSSGEIDIIEGVNTQTQNQMSLHTGPNCVMSAGPMSGYVNTMQCDEAFNYNSGCGVTATTPNTYGTPFNTNNGGPYPNTGGVYATEWTSNAITTWFFPRGSIPADIKAGTPNPANWGLPQSNFVGGSGCDIDSHFANHNVVFDVTFCGDWAGNAYTNNPTCMAKDPSCHSYVANNPAVMQGAYWQVDSLKVYQLGTPPSPTTTSSTQTTSSTKPTSKTSTTTTSTKPTATAANWTNIGCYSEGTSGRALTQSLTSTVSGGSASMTVEGCQVACKAAGYSVAGLEYAQECWCGNAFANGGAYLGADGTNGCTKTCKGNVKELCGGSSRLSSYKWG